MSGMDIYTGTHRLLSHMVEHWEAVRERMPARRRPGDRSIEERAFRLWCRNTLALKLPRQCGKTTAALRVAAARGEYAYMTANVRSALVVANANALLRENGYFASPKTAHARVPDDADIKTLIYDGIYASERRWRVMLTEWVDRGRRLDQATEDLLILRIE